MTTPHETVDHAMWQEHPLRESLLAALPDIDATAQEAEQGSELKTMALIVRHNITMREQFYTTLSK